MMLAQDSTRLVLLYIYSYRYVILFLFVSEHQGSESAYCYGGPE